MTEEQKEAKRIYRKKYYEENKERLNHNKKEYRKNNKVKISEHNKKWLADNKVKRTEYKKKFYQENKERIQKYDNEYRQTKIKTDPKFKIKESIRKSIIKSLKAKNFTKTSKTHEIIGCSFEEFKIHIESQWENWMNWDNYGNPKDGILEPNKTWDIDHIIPLATAITEEDIIKLNHYTNLQPLCSYTNRKIKRDN